MLPCETENAKLLTESKGVNCLQKVTICISRKEPLGPLLVLDKDVIGAMFFSCPANSSIGDHWVTKWLVLREAIL